MSINIGKFVRLLFWIKFVPVRRRKTRPRNEDNDNDNDERPPRHRSLEEPDDEEEEVFWEPDYTSPKFLGLMVGFLASDAAYIYLTYCSFTKSLQQTANIFTYTVLIFKG